MFGWRRAPQDSVDERKKALKSRLYNDLVLIPPEAQEEAVFARQPEEGRPGGALPPHTATDVIAISWQRPGGAEVEPGPLSPAEPEVAASAPVVQMPGRTPETANPGAGPEDDEEKVMADSREYWQLTREMRSLEGEKACRERTLKDRQETCDQMLQNLTKMVSNGGSNPGTQFIGAAAGQLERAKEDLNDWLEQSRYLEKRRKFDELTKRMRRYYPFL
ncbi:MAG TPA: hypothetical protein VGK74_20745 [Symbiobacteriaceae bacterium]